MIKHLNKETVHEHLLQKEKLLESKTKAKYSGNMSTTRNGRWLSQVRFYNYPFLLLSIIFYCSVHGVLDNITYRYFDSKNKKELFFAEQIEYVRHPITHKKQG